LGGKTLVVTIDAGSLAASRSARRTAMAHPLILSFKEKAVSIIGRRIKLSTFVPTVGGNA
jgi:hypothetical protein